MEFGNCDSNANKVKLCESVRKGVAEIFENEPEALKLLLRTCLFFSKIHIGSKTFWFLRLHESLLYFTLTKKCTELIIMLYSEILFVILFILFSYLKKIINNILTFVKFSIYSRLLYFNPG